MFAAAKACLREASEGPQRGAQLWALHAQGGGPPPRHPCAPCRAGIVLDGSRYVHVKGAEVDVAGDALGLQASTGKALEHVDVIDCR